MKGGSVSQSSKVSYAYGRGSKYEPMSSIKDENVKTLPVSGQFIESKRSNYKDLKNKKLSSITEESFPSAPSESIQDSNLKFSKYNDSRYMKSMPENSFPSPNNSGIPTFRCNENKNSNFSSMKSSQEQSYPNCLNHKSNLVSNLPNANVSKYNNDSSIHQSYPNCLNNESNLVSINKNSKYNEYNAGSKLNNLNDVIEQNVEAKQSKNKTPLMKPNANQQSTFSNYPKFSTNSNYTPDPDCPEEKQINPLVTGMLNETPGGAAPPVNQQQGFSQPQQPINPAMAPLGQPLAPVAPMPMYPSVMPLQPSVIPGVIQPQPILQPQPMLISQPVVYQPVQPVYYDPYYY